MVANKAFWGYNLLKAQLMEESYGSIWDAYYGWRVKELSQAVISVKISSTYLIEISR